MAEKLTEQTTLSTLTTDTLIYVVDGGESYKTTLGELLLDLGLRFTIAGFENYSVKKGTGNTSITALEVGDRIEGTGAYYGGDFIIGTVNTSPVTQDSHITVLINLGTGA